MSELYDIPDAQIYCYTLNWHYLDRANVTFESHLYGGEMLELFREM